MAISWASGERAAKLWAAGGALVCIVVAALAWFVFISPKMSDVNSVKSQTADAELNNNTLRLQVAQLEKENEGIAQLRASLLSARAALPIGDALPAFTEELSSLAAGSGVTLTSITAGTPAPAQPASATTATPAAAPSTSSTASTAAPAPAAGATGAAVPGQLYTIPVTLVTSGNLGPQLSMLKSVQHGSRAALVQSVQFSPSTGTNETTIDKDVTMTADLQVFVAPQTPQQAAELLKQLGVSATK